MAIAVHPRRCGEQIGASAGPRHENGSSPQVRGTGRRRHRNRNPETVHPRRCGEQWRRRVSRSTRCGSSPQVRGTGRETEVDASIDRFIPAGAGNRPRCGSGGHAKAVHPRRCGEQLHGRRPAVNNAGSSPQVRGTVESAPAKPVEVRFIPAGAGNSRPWVCSRVRPSVHPRRCGEQGHANGVGRAVRGSSPQVRGTGPLPCRGGGGGRFIPAGAGNREAIGRSAEKVPVHPRRCGEQDRPPPGGVRPRGSSPQVRGTDTLTAADNGKVRFIPAGAGNRCRS